VSMAKRRAEGEAEGAYGLAADPRTGDGGGGQATRDEAIAAGVPRLPHVATHARRSSPARREEREAASATPRERSGLSPVKRVAVY
jgi:hypothetical protein